MIMLKNESESCGDFQKIDNTEDEQMLEINCVFCGQVFSSIEGVQDHITEIHEINDQPSTKKETVNDVDHSNTWSLNYSMNATPQASTSILYAPQEKLTVFDAYMNLVDIKQVELEQVKLCMRCNRHFFNEKCLTDHQFMEHSIRKRKRPTHPNCVEGIKVTFAGTWSCDICTRDFATLKQAKVHKFKSHIEPAQKQEMSLNAAPHKQIQNSDQNVILQPQTEIPPSESLFTHNSITTTTNLNDEVPTIKLESTLNEDVVLPTSTVKKPEAVWRVKLCESQETKISFSKVIETAVPKENSPNIHNPFFAFNSNTSQYKCSHCPAMFNSRAVYSRHILVHRRGKAFGCDGCGMAFTRNHTLKQHRDSKCVIANPVLGRNCLPSDQCPKCGIYFASSNSHLSHCKKICKVIFGTPNKDFRRESMKLEEVQTPSEELITSDINGDNLMAMIYDPAFVTKNGDEFLCSLCTGSFPSIQTIAHHLEDYHRIENAKNVEERHSRKITENVSKKHSPKPMPHSHQYSWMTQTNNATVTPSYKKSDSDKLNVSSNNNSSFTDNELMPRVFRKVKVQPNVNGDYECSECHKTFGCRSSLSNHIKSHFNLKNKPFSCGTCNQGFMSPVSYDEHINNGCQGPCGMPHNAVMVTNPSAPMYSPSTARSASCMHCNAIFQDRSMLEDHAARDHSNDNGEVQCIACTRSFSTYMAFRVHMTKSHGGPNGTPLKNNLSTIMSLPRECSFLSLQNAFLGNCISGQHKCTKCQVNFNSAVALEEHIIICGENANGEAAIPRSD